MTWKYTDYHIYRQKMWLHKHIYLLFIHFWLTAERMHKQFMKRSEDFTQFYFEDKEVCLQDADNRLQDYTVS
jgi:hypothetical protein